MPVEAESLYKRFGGLELPVRAADIGEAGLSSLYPGRDALLELLKSAINSEFTEVWAATAALLPTGHPFRTAPVVPVRDHYPDTPTEELLTQRSNLLPLLALGPKEDDEPEYIQQTMEIGGTRRLLTLHYILGPLDIIDQRKLKPMCQMVADLVPLVIRERRHLSYQSGAIQFFSADPLDPLRGATFASLKAMRPRGPGQAVFGGDNSAVTYWAMEIDIETVELESVVQDAEGPLDAADIIAGVGGGEGLTPSLVLGATDAEPSAS